MVRSRANLLDRVLAVTLAVIMLFAVIPISTLTAFALSYEAGNNCPEDSCTGQLQWILNPENGAHHLVCDNEECVRNALVEAFVIHNEGEGGDDCLLCNPTHTHGAFTYSVENDNKTLVATCGNAGTCDLVDKKVSITIAAPANLEYDGTVKAATISGAEEWKTATGNEAPTISYNAEPKTVGTYTASITVDEVTASVEFTIVKGNPVYSVPTHLTAKYGQTLADVVLPAGFTWDNQTASVGNIGVNTFKATFTPSDTDNYNIVYDIDINVTVGKATSVIAAPSISGEATQTTITLEAVTPTVGDGNVEYGYIADEAKKDDPSNVTNWQTGTTFTGLEGSKTYYFYARVSETTNYTAATSAVSSISTKNKLNGELTISIDSWIYDGTAADPDFDIVTGDYGLAKVEYLNLDEEVAVYSETAPTKAGHYRARVSCEATAKFAEAAEYCDFEIKQKEVTIAWSNTSVVYNAQNQNPVATITAGIVGADDLTVVVSGEEKNVGVDYTAEATLSGAAKDNYVIKSNKTQLFTITTKEVAITWTNTSLIHNEGQQKPTATINDDEIFDDDVDFVNIEVSGAVKTPGNHTATASLKGTMSQNYHIKSELRTCAFIISTHSIPEDPYKVVKADSSGNPTADEAHANQNHWYNYNICIIPNPNFEIALSDNSDNDFSSHLFVDSSKENYAFFLKCTDSNCAECKGKGGYTSALLVGDVAYGETFNNEIGKINIDKDLPKAHTKINGGSAWDVFLETITFGVYRNTEVTVTLSGEDTNSSVDHIYYHKVEKNRIVNEDLYENGDSIPSWTEGTSVIVNSDNDYVVYVKVVDKAGNISYASTDGFVFDATKSKIEVSFDNNEVLNDKYFKANRTATIKITEHNFDATKVVLSVTENGANTSSNYALNWSTNGDVHTATVLFENEADYTFAISSTDKAGNANEPVVYADGSKATNEFTIDKSRPNASLVIEGLVKDADESWKETWATADGDDLIARVLTSINYNNRWSNGNAKVSATSTDNLSGVDYIEYFRTENVVVDITADSVTWSNSTKESNTKDAFNFEVAPNEKFIVYVHIVDKAGNDIYLSSNGVIVDDKEPGGDNYSPEIDITLPEANKNGIYNEDDTVKVDFKVVEPKYSGANNKVDTGIYSGIKEIKYVIKAEDINAVEEKVFNLSNGSVVDNNGLIGSWTGSITIDKDKFNSNNVVVLITAIDNAGNVHTSTTKVGDIKIDVTAPVINIEYDNNAADSESFFKDKRTATVTITERNFADNEDIIVTITNTDNVIPKISAFKKVEGTDGGNGDNTQWEATIVYEADGDYTFAIAYTDLADNVCEKIEYADNTVAATEFTVDNIDPTIKVVYDNNSALNDKFFKANRTATITIVEHNFNVDRVEFVRDAVLDTKDITDPEIKWEHNGDTHIATIVYDADGDYTFDVTMTDMAGRESGAANYGDTVAGKEFTVDKTIAKPSITGVENGKAYKNDVIPVISLDDVNFAEYEAVLTRTRKGEKNVDVTDKFINDITTNAKGGSATNDKFEKIADNDGIYTLKVTMSDKAGNTDEETVTFTVNRFGSVYDFGEYLTKLVANGGSFEQKITEDIVLTEYNPDRLVADSLVIEITKDGKPVENVKYDVTPVINDQVAIGESGWFQYAYTINKENFAADGVYKIAISSKDATGNTPENSNFEDKNILFRVDSTTPEITSITGLEEDIINAQEVTVKYTIFDAIGLKSVTVFVDGKKVGDAITDFNGDANNYSGEFVLTESSSAQKVRILVEDLAGNITDTDAEDFESAYEFNNSVTVSTNIFVRWYANKGLFWGSISGVVVLSGGISTLVTYRRRKKLLKK